MTDSGSNEPGLPTSTPPLPERADPAAHPCLRCGACCTLRVAFHWSEAAPELGGRVPVDLTEKLDAHRVVMRGTWGGSNTRCTALQGETGKSVHCAIYAQRPSPCRAFRAAWEDGQPSPDCDRARARHGLPPLSPADWTGAGAVSPA